ncbi:MAG: TAXI family TRAP transporter solute-binding subunit [Gemmatimonas sp.]
MRKIETIGLALVGALFAVSAAAADLNFATGRQGGSQYPVSVALAQVIEKVPGVDRVSLVPGGGTGNVISVGTGKTQLGITLSNDAIAGIEGQPPYKEKLPDMVQLLALHAFNVAIIVPADSSIREFKDLAGHKVNSGPVGFTINTLSRHVYQMTGIEKQVQQGYLQIGDAVEQFKDGHIDALFYAPSDWFGPFIELAESRKLRLIQLPQDVMDTLLKEDRSFIVKKYPLQAGIYKNLENQVDTLANRNLIVANRKAIDDNQAYAIVKAVAENWDKVAPSEPSFRLFKAPELAENSGIPIHPGALRYFRERGWAQ